MQASHSQKTPTVDIQLLTHVFRPILVQYVDSKILLPMLRFILGNDYVSILDASHKDRREGVERLLNFMEKMPDQRGVSKLFMDNLKKTGYRFLYDVILGNDKLDEKWEIYKLLIKTEGDLLKVSPVELMVHLPCLNNQEREQIRATHDRKGPTIACSELLLTLESKPPESILEIIRGLRDIKKDILAQSLESAYKHLCKEQSDGRNLDDDGGDGDGGDGDGGDGLSRGSDEGSQGSDGDGGGVGGAGGAGDSDSREKSVNSVSEMLQLLDAPSSSAIPASSTDSSEGTALDGRNTHRASGIRSSGDIRENLNLHDYQKELAKPALAGKNTLIVAPTGSGKTRVAVAIAKHALNPSGASRIPPKVVFVVNKVALVEQQKNAFGDFIRDVVGISGDMSSQVPLANQLEQADVIVLTAQILVNAIQDPRSGFSLTQLKLLILDECHNTQKGNAYNIIMASYRDLKKEKPDDDLPQVVGLTASLGVKKAKRQHEAEKHVLHLCANLDAEEISRVVQYKDSLEKSYHRPREKTFAERGRDDKDPFKIELEKVMDRIEGAMFSSEDGKEILRQKKEMKEMSSHRGTQQYEGEISKLIDYIPVNVKDNETARVLQDCALFLRVYNQSLYINRDARTVDAVNHIKAYIETLRDQDSQFIKKLIALFEGVNDRMEQICRSGSNENPVLKKLEEIFVDEYGKKPETLAILFTNTRDSTKALQAWIQETPGLEFLNPGILIGTGKSGMTQPQQEQLLAMFKEKKHKLVISTSVAEEGLDIQMCNLVMRYNYVRDDIGRVQARGRSRAEGGKFYLVFNSRLPKLAERERMNKIREKMMEDATKTVCDMIQKKNADYKANIEYLQKLDSSERSLQKSGELAAKKRLKSKKKQRDVRLLCKHCRSPACYTDDIRTINGQHHIVVSDEFQKQITTVKFDEAKCLYDDVLVSKEVQCKSCRKQWGYMMVYKGHELPLLSIKFLVIKIANGNLVHKKKWNEAATIFAVKEIDLEDLSERLRISEEEEDDDETEEKDPE